MISDGVPNGTAAPGVPVWVKVEIIIPRRCMVRYLYESAFNGKKNDEKRKIRHR